MMMTHRVNHIALSKQVPQQIIAVLLFFVIALACDLRVYKYEYVFARRFIARSCFRSYLATRIYCWLSIGDGKRGRLFSSASR